MPELLDPRGEPLRGGGSTGGYRRIGARFDPELNALRVRWMILLGMLLVAKLRDRSAENDGNRSDTEAPGRVWQDRSRIRHTREVQVFLSAQPGGMTGDRQSIGAMSGRSIRRALRGYFPDFSMVLLRRHLENLR